MVYTDLYRKKGFISMLLMIQIKLTIGACQIFKKEELMQVFAAAIVHQRQNIWGVYKNT